MTSNLPQSIASYQKHFTPVTPNENFVYSTLGAWSLVAFLSKMNQSSLTEAETVNVEKFLGCTIDEAAEQNELLFSTENKDVDVDAKGWFVEDFTGFSDKIRNMVEESENQAMDVISGTPTQEQLDGWVTEATHGLIKKFPVEVNSDLLALLATVVATNIEWRTPYEETPEGAEPWSVDSMLQRETDVSGDCGFFTSNKGVIGYTKNYSENGLEVYSFISEEKLSLTELDALATDYLVQQRNPAESEFTMLPVSDIKESGVFWDVKKTTIESNYDMVSWNVTLPAWEAESELDLLEKDYGFMSAGAEIIREGNRFNPVDGVDVKVVQKCVAKYGKNGFEAAAVTAFGLFRASGMMAPPSAKTRYDVKLNFNKPHVVIAMATDYRNSRSPWHRLPVFNAHVYNAVTV